MKLIQNNLRPFILAFFQMGVVIISCVALSGRADHILWPNWLKIEKFTWIQLVFLAWISPELSLFSWPDNYLNLARFPGMKISFFQLIFVAEKSTEISPFSFSEYHLNWACFPGMKISLFQLIFVAEKINWFQLVFLPEKSNEIISFSWLENQLI